MSKQNDLEGSQYRGGKPVRTHEPEKASPAKVVGDNSTRHGIVRDKLGEEQPATKIARAIDGGP
jgi:hypothetical protein